MRARKGPGLPKDNPARGEASGGLAQPRPVAVWREDGSRGGLALDALHLLSGDMDRAGELVSLEYPVVHHLLDRRAADAEVLGRLHHGNDFSILVFHPNLPARQRQGPGTLKDTRPVILYAFSRAISLLAAAIRLQSSHRSS